MIKKAALVDRRAAGRRRGRASGRVADRCPKTVPTAHVQRGRVQVTVYTVGDLRASRAIQLAAPPMGGQLQIVQLAETGDAVKAGDVVVEFDAAEQEFNLEQARFDLQLAEQEIVKADAQAAVQVAEDEVALLHARYDVRRAELDLLEQRAGDRDQGAAERADASTRRSSGWSQLEADVKTHRETTRASADGVREKRNKAQLSVQVAERNIESLHVRAPFDGVVIVRTNFQAFGGIYFGGAMPDYRDRRRRVRRPADRRSHRLLAHRSDREAGGTGSRQRVAGADRRGRGRRAARCDAARERSAASAASRRAACSTRARASSTSRSTSRANPAVRPGVSAAIAISGAAYDNVLYVPRTAVFDVSGRPTVYIRSTGGFDAHEVRVRAWTDSVAVVENIEPAAEVALVNPNTPSGARAKTPPQAPQRAAR